MTVTVIKHSIITSFPYEKCKTPSTSLLSRLIYPPTGRFLPIKTQNKSLYTALRASNPIPRSHGIPVIRNPNPPTPFAFFTQKPTYSILTLSLPFSLRNLKTLQLLTNLLSNLSFSFRTQKSQTTPFKPVEHANPNKLSLREKA
jgi:hypothetical protein